MALEAKVRFGDPSGRLRARVYDAVGLEGGERDGKVECADYVGSGLLIHWLLFSVTEHMFVRYGRVRTGSFAGARIGCEPVFTAPGVKSGLQTTRSRSIGAP